MRVTPFRQMRFFPCETEGATSLSRVFRVMNGSPKGREAAGANWLLTATIFRQSLRTRRYTAAPKTSLIYFLSQAVQANARLE